MLGAVTVLRDGVPVDLGGPQRRAVLTLLLVHANRAVSVDTLADLLWGGSPPRSYRVQLQGVVSDLRRRLAVDGSRAAAPIVTRPSGYALEVPDGALDLHVFRAEVEIGRLESAVARWRGPAFGGFDYPGAQAVVAGVEEERWTAVEDLVDAKLAAGRIDGLSAELARLTREHPLRERFHAQLMTVLARTSRVGDALAVYRRLRERLVDELGIEPSAPIHRLHQRILAASADAGPGERSPGSREMTTRPVPVDDGGVDSGDGDRLAAVSAYRQLPPDLADFVGRDEELQKILARGRARTTAARIVVVDGMAGVGKTRLAVRAAHQLVAEGRYLGGQLYIDLAREATPAAALSHMLRLLGVPPHLVPADLDARTALLRDRLADRDILMILDSVVDERQVEPLLAAGGLVIVTSRRGLALDGALHITLSMFTTDEGMTLLGSVIGADRLTAERSAAADLVARCGHLPLAVTVAAHRLRMRPAWSVAGLVDRLAAARGFELDELTVGSRAVEAVFQHAYDTLPVRIRLVFRRLGLHPGVNVTAASVAALADIDPGEAATAVEELLDLHLLLQEMPGRYRLHDLLRAFAQRACGRDDPPDAADAAVGDLLDWYVGAVESVSQPLNRFRIPVANRVPPTKTPVPSAGTHEQALAWLDDESANLLAVLRLADARGRRPHAIVLAHLLRPYFIRRAPLAEWIAVLRLAETAARGSGELSELAHTLAELGHAHGGVGLFEVESELLRQAIELHDLCGDGYGRAVALNHLGTAQRRLGRYAESVDLYRTALAEFEAQGDAARIASTASNLSIVLHMLGRDDEAIGYAEQAVRVDRTIGGPGEAALRTNLGRIYTRIGDHARAVEHCERALRLHRVDGSRVGEATALATLCVSYAELGRRPQAIRVGRLAVEIARRIANPEVEAAAFNSLGEAYAVAGRRAVAQRRHRRALAILGDRGDADERGRALRGL